MAHVIGSQQYTCRRQTGDIQTNGHRQCV